VNDGQELLSILPDVILLQFMELGADGTYEVMYDAMQFLLEARAMAKS